MLVISIGFATERLAFVNVGCEKNSAAYPYLKVLHWEYQNYEETKLETTILEPFLLRYLEIFFFCLK